MKVNLTKEDKDPEGGLSSQGRAKLQRVGQDIKPGVTKPFSKMTLEDMKRKGSFLTRFYTNPSGPLQDEKGRPTRLALAANAWGEPVPENAESAKRLAEKGRRLLENYRNKQP